MPRFTVDVKAFINLTVEAADWMEARSKANSFVETCLSPTQLEVEGYNSVLPDGEARVIPYDYTMSVDGESEVEECLEEEWDGEGKCPKCQGDMCDPESGCIFEDEEDAA